MDIMEKEIEDNIYEISDYIIKRIGTSTFTRKELSEKDK